MIEVQNSIKSFRNNILVKNLKFIPNFLASTGNSKTFATEIFYLAFFSPCLVSPRLKLF